MKVVVLVFSLCWPMPEKGEMDCRRYTVDFANYTNCMIWLHFRRAEYLRDGAFMRLASCGPRPKV